MVSQLTHFTAVIILLKAASVNPIDTVMRNGYGDRLFSALKQVKSCSCKPVSRLPFIGGRDCSGVVEMVGGNVTDFKPGDEVSNAKYICCKTVCVSKIWDFWNTLI